MKTAIDLENEIPPMRGRVDWLLAIRILALLALATTNAPSQQSLTVDAVHTMEADGKDFILVDVRSAAEFQPSHIQGAINVPAPMILKAQLSKAKPLVLYCDSASCMASDAAAHTLVGNGYNNVSVLEGGIAAWAAKAYPLAIAPTTPPPPPIKHISPKDLNNELSSKSLTIVDVRPAKDFRAGHLPGAINIPLETLSTSPTGLDATKPVIVYDRKPQRSLQAAKQLQSDGFSVRDLSGGITVWAAMKYPLQI